MLNRKILILTTLTLTLGGFSFHAWSAKRQFITIGTGGVTGLYYPTGGAVCGMVNKGKSEHGIRCNVEATGGSVYNVNSMASVELDLGIVQSDVVYKAWKGEEPFGKAIEKLRSVFSIHSETVTLVARKASKINKLSDIKGKRVNIGNPGSGQKRTTTELLKACNIKESSLALAGSLKAAEMPDALRDGKLDAYFYVVGHPTANIKDIATSTDINIVPLRGKCIDKLVSKRPYYVKSSVPEGMYRGVERDVPTYGVKGVLLTTTDISEETIYQLVKSVFENLDSFKDLHPAYHRLTQKSMLQGLSVPFHPGAERYFKEKGLL